MMINDTSDGNAAQLAWTTSWKNRAQFGDNPADRESLKNRIEEWRSAVAQAHPARVPHKQSTSEHPLFWAASDVFQPSPPLAPPCRRAASLPPLKRHDTRDDMRAKPQKACAQQSIAQPNAPHTVFQPPSSFASVDTPLKLEWPGFVTDVAGWLKNLRFF